HRSVFRDILLSDNSDPGSGDLQNKSEYALDETQGTDVLFYGGKFSNDPFCQKNRNGQDQKSYYCNYDQYKTYHFHYLFVSFISKAARPSWKDAPKPV